MSHPESPGRAGLPADANADRASHVLDGGGAMGALMRELDWSATPVGAPDTWPQSLRTAVGILLESRFPMYIAWGPQFVQLYNDGYRPILGSTKHPAALGGSARETFAESWAIIGPMFDGVMRGIAVGSDDWMLPLDRHGYLEECYFTFSYSPIRGERGQVAGILVTVTETTARVLGERRLRTLRDLAERAAAARTEDEAWRGAAHALTENQHDVPFALLYRLPQEAADGDASRLGLVAAAGWGGALPALPPTEAAEQVEERAEQQERGAGRGVWPLALALTNAAPQLVADVRGVHGDLPGGPWPEPPSQALILPVTRAGAARPFGVLVAGVSARRTLDEDYRSFLQLAVGQVAAAVGHARAFLEEKSLRDEAVRIERAHAEDVGRLLEEARLATRARAETLAVVTHDLRNPLSAITISTALIEHAIGDDERSPRLRRSVDAIRRAASRMDRLIGDLLDLASIDAGSLSLEPELHTAEDLLRELGEMFEAQASAQGVALVSEVAGDVPALRCDRGRFLQAMGNLVSNALKVTAPPGSVALRALVEPDGKAVRFEVSDDGPGVPEPMRPHIFDRHWHARRENRGGNGMGLSIAKGIVERHGGEIHLTCPDDRGSTFWFTLPVTGATRTAPSARSSSTAPPAWQEKSQLPSPEETFLRGGGDMGKLTRAYDWSTTSLGAVSSWPQSLRTSVSTMLRSPYPITMFWGPELIMLYNDAFAPIHGAKHPAVLGMPAPSGLVEAWGQLGPLVEGVLASGEPLFIENAAVLFERGAGGIKEEAYFTWCYIPTADEAGGIAGLFAIASETTAQMLGDRRLTILRELSIRTAHDRDLDAVFSSVEAVLTQAGADLPFALLYRLEGDEARLVSCVGLERDAAGAPLAPRLDDAPWPLARVARTQQEELIEGLDRLVGPLPGGPWPDPATRALLLPVPIGADGASAVLVAGLSPLRPLDDTYRSFLQLLARQIAASASSARAYDRERQRAEQLAELDRAKTAFFSNVSHELRTPLTLILGPVEDALARGALDGEQLHRVRRNVLRLARMVNTLLDFSRMESGRAEATYVPVDLSALTADLASAFRTTVESAGIELIVDCPPLPESVHVDPEMWEKIVFNLLSNAVKYTHRGSIRVALRKVETEIAFTVEDTGVGIPAQELPRVFERFYRVRSTEGRSHEGTGIGLALVLELVKLHGGRVDVESSLGAGTTFTVSLQPGTAHLAPQRVRPATLARASGATAAPFVEEARQWSVAPGVAASTAASVETPPRAAAGARILLVDDNADLRSYVAEVLERSFPGVDIAHDGMEALVRVAAQRPDLVLSDVMMPRLDGLGLVRALRADPSTRAIPIILLSARAGEDSTVEGLASGADDYLVKPFSARELLARVGTQLEMARVRRDAARHERDQERLRDAVRMRDDWLNLVGHELRTPVSALSLGMEGLLRSLDPQRRDGVSMDVVTSRAEGAARLLRRLEDRVEELVSISELVTGSWEASLEPVDIGELVSAVVEERRAQAERAGTALEVSLAEGIVAPVDRARLLQALRHLLDNALKFGAGRPVQIALRREGEQATIALMDHGVGVPLDARPHIFDRFARGSSLNHYGGFGLGLWVARRVVEAQHGAVTLGETPGGGATVTLELPLTPPTIGRTAD